MDYADSDYKNLYSYGPMNYKQVSKENNNQNAKNKFANQSVESEML